MSLGITSVGQAASRFDQLRNYVSAATLPEPAKATGPRYWLTCGWRTSRWYGAIVEVVNLGGRQGMAHGRRNPEVHRDARRCVHTPWIGVALVAISTAASADSIVSEIEVPAVMMGVEVGSEPETDLALDLANIVRSAAKGITSVQEAPAIVSVVTSDEIRDRQFRDFQQIVETIPGWLRIGYWDSTAEHVLARGQVQAVKFLHDGSSLFDPFLNLPTMNRTLPLELVKRVEMITGPGGVLWGANSLLGIINVITKDAEDVDGVEAGATLGDGFGDRRAARAYVMGGVTNLANSKFKLFVHGAVDSYAGMGTTMPLPLYLATLPLPTAPSVYGPLTTSSQQRSLLAVVDGKLSYDKFRLRWQLPFGDMFHPLGIAGQPARKQRNSADRVGNQFDHYDRYAALEYQSRFANNKAGVSARSFITQFIRRFQTLEVLAPSPAIPDGLVFHTNASGYVTGAAIDGDLDLDRKLRLLYGAEAFYEWIPINTRQSLGGPGLGSTLVRPTDLTAVPLLCPREFRSGMLAPIAECPLTAVYEADRTSLGLYANPQYRPFPTLILDAGARVTVTPRALGSLSYKATPTLSGAIVWNFVPNWHLKLNYAEGFRTPTFNNTQGNGEGIQIAGNPNLLVEQSRAGQAEINARIYKGQRNIRELAFRFDVSYTDLTNFIQVESQQYFNSGKRGITSAEFLGKLHLKGNHRIELAYTYLRGNSVDRGRLRTLPEHWFALATVWTLLPQSLTVTTNLRITGATEDANRLVEYRDIRYDVSGQPTGVVTPTATDVVLDRLPPIAELSAGLQYQPTSKISIGATIFNALYAHAYQPDVYGDYQPNLEYLPNPYEGVRAYLTAAMRY